MNYKCVFVFLLLGALTAAAQVPDKFTNLQVLPKDIPKAELTSTMRKFAFALGTRCEHCHVQKTDQSFDYSLDDKEAKKTARVMLQMVATVNRNYIAKIAQPAPVQVECVTCHHGVTQPRTLNSILAEAISKQGGDAAVSTYQELRTKYYGTGAYDFSDVPLNQLTESLLAQKKTKEAVAIMEMNFAANNPTSVYSYHMLAMSHQANGQTEKARQDYAKDVELHPDDVWAKKQLDTLTGSK
jgi:hypothetical protein